MTMRVVIAEDSFVVRAGLVEVLSDRGHDVAAAVGDADALLAAVAEHRPAAVVVDVRMPPTHTDEGLRVAARLHTDHPDVAVLLFSQYVDVAAARELLALRPGGIGYLLKENVADIDEFDGALRRIAAGGTVLDPGLVRQMLAAGRSRRPMSALTARELDVLALLAQGRSNSAISSRLSITNSAVEKHVAGIFMKLGLDTSQDDNRRVLAVLWYLDETT